MQPFSMLLSCLIWSCHASQTHTSDQAQPESNQPKEVPGDWTKNFQTGRGGSSNARLATLLLAPAGDPNSMAGARMARHPSRLFPARRAKFANRVALQRLLKMQECDTETFECIDKPELAVGVQPEVWECIGDECVGDRSSSGISYRAQFDDLFSKPLEPHKPVPKPSMTAQARDSKAVKVPFSNVYGTLMKPTFRKRKWTKTDIKRAVFFSTMHIVGAFAPFYFSWKMLIPQFLMYVASGMGITYSYHRQLSHKSFQSPKWLEYMAAYCGMMAMQGAPLDWVSEHRYHHLHTETPLDPHSSYEGFYWSHIGWLLDSDIQDQRCSDMSNAKDISCQPFYQFTSKWYGKLVMMHFAMVYAVGGFAALAWRSFFVSMSYHVTWFVNSAAHVWGKQEYYTGDQSRNNWWVGFLAFGEGWHNNHHAFEYSARHGLRRHQFDITWITIRLFRALGLVSKVKLPTERAKQRLRDKYNEKVKEGAIIQ
jgi:stearoyl-CoA desaturase (delta-9 desaturase)